MITVFGSINLDLVTCVKDLPRPGETVFGSPVERYPGGKGANQALAARRAGAEVALVGAVGTDDFAALALAELQRDGVDLDGVARGGEATGVAVITVDEAGENTIVLAPGANNDARADQLDAARFGPGHSLVLQLEVPHAECFAAARLARDGGARVILSLAPFAPLSRETLEPVSMLLMNETEAADLARHYGLAGADHGATVRALAQALDLTVVATLGPEGAVASDGGTPIRVASLQVEPVDTTGAGDTFAGVLAASLDVGADLESALRRAAVAGSLACTRAGAQPSFPTREEIEKAMAL